MDAYSSLALDPIFGKPRSPWKAISCFFSVLRQFKIAKSTSSQEKKPKQSF
jgi:hypothetical protein